MDSQRNLFVIAFLFVSLMLWQVWEYEKNSHLYQQSTQTEKNKIDDSTRKNLAFDQKRKKITIQTDVLHLTINMYGGDIEQALLLAYPKKLNSNEPFRLLETTQGFIYQAQSGLTGRDGPDNPENGSRPLYHAEKDNFFLSDGKREITVPLTHITSSGHSFTKIFILKRGEYAVHVNYKIENKGRESIEVANFGQLKQSVNLASSQESSSNLSLHTFRGAAYSTPDSKYVKHKFDAIEKNKNLSISTESGWVAMLQQYFATAWIPNEKGIKNFYTANLGDGIVAIGYKSDPILVDPGQTAVITSSLWIGPEIQDKMASVAENLDLTVDYGWLWFISQPLFKLLKFIQGFLGNWGLSIIAITFIVRAIMHPLTKAQYTSMVKMRMLQPKIQAMRERIGNDKHRQNQEMIALYKSEKVNPLGGCFPLLIQMPIFLALYYMLMCSVELRHAPFVMWIHDLSGQDPYYILPVLMGVTMFLIQKISPSNVTDPIQKKIMGCMPIIFTAFFLWFPSGLVLYYVVSNLVTIIQQKLIYRTLKKGGLLSY